MTLAIVQLSDIHLQNSRNIILSRVGNIASALRPIVEETQCLIIAITGDIAFSGSRDQYAIAKTFIDNLVDTLRTSIQGATVRVVAIPGNHDCDLSSKSDLRPRLLETLKANLTDMDPTGETIQTVA